MNLTRVVFFFAIALFAACDQRTDTYETPAYFSYQVLPQSTDERMKFSSVFHLAYVNTRISSSGKLFVFLGDTTSLPQNYLAICKSAVSLGYFVINLNYVNNIVGQSCDGQDENCFAKYHEEVLFGGDLSNLVEVSGVNSVTNRILKLLQYLHSQNPNNGWNQFYDSTALNYSKFILAGHSQGGGHVAYLAQKHAVDRVVLFSSPNDYTSADKLPAIWLTNSFATSADKFYGLAHKRDEAFSITRQYAVWKSMGMLVASDTSSADSSNYSNYNVLVTNFMPDTDAVKQPVHHNLPVRDYALPDGDDRKQLKKVWLYMLGISGK